MSQFERFSKQSRQVLMWSQEEAVQYNHDYIGTEHLLLALTRLAEGTSTQALESMGVQLPKIRSAVDFIIGRGESEARGDIGLTPRAKKIFELAVDECRRLKHSEIEPEHFLLALLREGEGIAAGILQTLGVTHDRARLAIIKLKSNEVRANLPQTELRSE